MGGKLNHKLAFFSTAFLMLSLMTCNITRYQKMTAPHSLSIIPKPAEIHLGEGVFEINAETKIYFQPQTADIRAIAEDLAYHVTATTGLALQAEPFSPTTPMFHAIVLKIQPIDTALGLEGYQLTVHQNAIEMIAHQPAGLFYAVQ
ncbi:MAG: glycoside hydrolase family 20 zincin-like fold domain-containing protein, partial [candidate division KSB1 bacterium]|nr:glycoside hydrolase family 20 zincin-like fold domain-containing protein [candidate division KSB1 bacterium]